MCTERRYKKEPEMITINAREYAAAVNNADRYLRTVENLKYLKENTSSFVINNNKTGYSITFFIQNVFYNYIDLRFKCMEESIENACKIIKNELAKCPCCGKLKE